MRHLVCVVWLITWAGLAQAAPYKSLKGYRVDCPEDWWVSGRDDPRLMERIDRGLIPGLANVDFNTIDVMLVDPAADFTVGLTIGFRPSEGPFDAQSRKQWTKSIRQSAMRSNLKLILQAIGDIDVDGVAGLSFQTRWSYPRGLVQQWQVLVSSGTHLLLFTFFGPPEVFTSYRPQFEQIMGSVRLGNSPIRWAWVGSLVTSAVAGALVGGAVSAGVGWIINRHRAYRGAGPCAQAPAT